MPAKRAYGMDQDFYPWSPIVTRPVLRWPEGARVALAVIVNLEHWDWEGPPGGAEGAGPGGGRGGRGGAARGLRPGGRRGGAEEPTPAAIPRYRRLGQPRIRYPGGHLPHPRR